MNLILFGQISPFHLKRHVVLGDFLGQSENPVAILPPVFRGQSEKRLRETV